jgi:protein-disulfide isomerase
MKVAEGLGISAAALSDALADPGIDKPIQQSFSLARDLAIDGTPTYVIGRSVMAGAVGLKALRTAVANMRTCGKAACS